MKPILACLLGLAFITQGGCATVVSQREYPVVIDNVGAPTYYAVLDHRNKQVAQGITPDQVTLKSKSYPFVPAKYHVVFAGQQSKSESHELKAGFDKWLVGNILIGGGLGLIVDGANGAMYRLPQRVAGNVGEQYAVADSGVGAVLAKAHLQPDRVDVPKLDPALATPETVIATKPESSTLR